MTNPVRMVFFFSDRRRDETNGIRRGRLQRQPRTTIVDGQQRTVDNDVRWLSRRPRGQLPHVATVQLHGPNAAARWSRRCRRHTAGRQLPVSRTPVATGVRH